MIDKGTWLVVLQVNRHLEHRIISVHGLTETTEIANTLEAFGVGSLVGSDWVIQNMVKLSSEVSE